ncbi:hypothetical protein [Archangium lipolyticum]|uniref:hypothetical protein n=1 Tax=Archangium lipolyticum TaxID=2970465 RepID=UPI00214A1CFF|nr:hypothetical protein [Archangium lipolyticum]
MSSQSFNPSTINSYILFNHNYNVIPVKIRLKDASDPGAINLGPSQSLTFEVRYSGGKAKFYYTNKEVQQIDLNNGSSSDDLNTPNSDNNGYNTLRYVPSNRQGASDIINFDVNTFETLFTDNDGIAGGGTAIFTQAIQGSAIRTALSST